MRKLKALSGPAENYVVLADDLAFANRLNRDFLLNFLRRFQNLSERFGRSAGGVLFHFVMRLDDLRIEIRTEQVGSFPRQPEQYIHANAEIRRENNRH